MNFKVFTLIFFVCCIGCITDRDENDEAERKKPDNEMVFDEAKWKTKDGADYPFREKMLHDVLYNDSIRVLNKDEVLDLLGDPDRINENHLYYMISQKRLGFWPLTTKTLVIKFSDDNTIEWMKVHE